MVDVRPRSSEMWIRPSMPSRSTNAPKSTMFEIVPSTTWPGWSRSRIRSRSSLRCSSSTARRDSTTLLRERLSSITLHSIASPMYSSRFGTRRMSTSEAGRKPRTPRSMIRPPLTTSITVPSTGSPDSAAASILRHAFSNRARFLERIEPSVLVLLGEDERVDLLAEAHLLAGIDGLADRQLAGGDDPFGLVADVDQHFVVVDPDDVAGDDIAFLEGMQGRVVVGDDLAVDLEQQAVRPFDDLGVGLIGGGVRVVVEDMCRRRIAASSRFVSSSLPSECHGEPRSAAISERRSIVTAMS